MTVVVSLTKNINGTSITFTFNDWEIESIKSTTMQTPDNTPITGTGAMGSYVYNYDGATKAITITGTIQTASTTRTSTGTVTSMVDQVKWLEGLFCGSSNSITFTSTYDSVTPDTEINAVSPFPAHYANTTVIGGMFEHDERNGEVNIVPFTLTLIVGQGF